MTAIDYTCMYTIVGPDGTTISFNKDTDPNFCGYLDNITGIDGAEVRENAQNRVAGDGGMHNNFYAGRMPFTLTGTVFPSVGSNAVQELMQSAVSKARRNDAQLLWTPTGTTIERMVAFRNQQPIRFTGKVPKTFNIAGVGADYRVLSSGINSSFPSVGSVPVCAVHNAGNEDANVMFVINGPIDGHEVIIRNELTGKQIKFLPDLIGVTPGAGLPAPATYPVGTMVINLVPDRLPLYLGFDVALGGMPSVDQYSCIDPLGTDWTIAAVEGDQNFTLIATGTDPTTTSLEVRWRDSWN